MNTAEKVALILTLWVGVVVTWAVSSTLAQSADLEEAKRLNNQVLQLYRQGKYAEAAPLAQKALNMNEKALGPDHPYVAISLNNLAALYRKSGREKEAEGLEKRAAAIRAIKR